VRWFAKNNGIPLVLNPIPFGDNAKPEFVAKSPYQAVPILELQDGGGVLTESCAIINYLALSHGKRAEYPEDPLQLARVHEAQFHNNDSLGRQFTAAVLRPQVPLYLSGTGTRTALQDTVTSNMASFLWEFSLLNDLFIRQKWIAGQTFSVADYNLICELNQWPVMESAGFLPESLSLAKYPGIARYLEDAKLVPNHDEFVADFVGFINTIKTTVDKNSS
jgi:glutathione S-transferase